MRIWPWFAGAGVLVLLGLVLWWTASIAWPTALVLLVVGLVKEVRSRRGT
jgi:hypothetical protein